MRNVKEINHAAEKASNSVLRSPLPAMLRDVLIGTTLVLGGVAYMAAGVFLAGEMQHMRYMADAMEVAKKK